jgi:hypothetical protein
VTTDKLAQLGRIRWAVRGVLVLGVAASVTANVLHAVDNPISQSIAAWPPLALLLTVELISRVPMHGKTLTLIRLFAAAVIAGIAAWVSYWHMVGVARRYGESVSSAYLIPLSVDGMIVVASICLVELSGRIHAAGAEHQPSPVEAAPPPPVVEPDSQPVPVDPGPPWADELPAQRVRQDPRTAQEIEDAVRAIWQARPDLSQRRIAAVAGTSPTNAGRIIREAKAAAAATEEVSQEPVETERVDEPVEVAAR